MATSLFRYLLIYLCQFCPVSMQSTSMYPIGVLMRAISNQKFRFGWSRSMLKIITPLISGPLCEQMYQAFTIAYNLPPPPPPPKFLKMEIWGPYVSYALWCYCCQCSKWFPVNWFWFFLLGSNHNDNWVSPHHFITAHWINTTAEAPAKFKNDTRILTPPASHLALCDIASAPVFAAWFMMGDIVMNLM